MIEALFVAGWMLVLLIGAVGLIVLLSRRRYGIAMSALCVLLLPYWPQDPLVIPVEGATTASWNHKTFWYSPWGQSGVHKGIDIFSAKGTDITAPTDCLVLWTGTLMLGGHAVVCAGMGWKLHYLAHLDHIDTHMGSFVAKGNPIGRVGNTGNAKSTPAHLHYSIVTLIPYPWRIDNATQGVMKAYYLDPGDQFAQ